MNQSVTQSDRIAVLLPCHNEEVTIAKVVADFASVLPGAKIYVYDNLSTDRTAEVAKTAGAIVFHEPKKGKGNVVRRMFADVDADFYVIADGDGTYHAPMAVEMLRLVSGEKVDMVVAVRQDSEKEAYRSGHRTGNRMFNWLLRKLFGSTFTDVFSGYRAFSRRFVKSFPAMSRGFDIETEMTVHALEIGLHVREVVAPYGSRPEGSQSKLRTYHHGMAILWRVFMLLREERPMQFFGGLALTFAVLSCVLIVPVLLTYIQTGLVPRFPTAILSASLMILAFLTFFSGIILDGVSRGRKDAKRLAFLGIDS